MRIGFDGKRIFHNFRGLGNYSRTLVEGIMKYSPENEIFLFTPKFKDQRALEWSATHSRARVISPGSKIFSSFWRTFSLAQELKKYDLDIYHGLSHELPFFSGKLKCRKVVTIHDLIFKRYPKLFSLIDRNMYSLKYSYSCKNSDLIIAICEQTRRDLIDLMGVPSKKIEVVYQSCNPIFANQLSREERSLFRIKYNLPENYILYVGALEPNKNALNLVRAFASLNFKDQFLILVGKGKVYKNLLLKEIETLGIKEKVIFFDFVPHDDLPGIYQLAKLFVFPSVFEGFGIPIIESLFSKTPVITTKGYCFPEAGGPSSEYVDTSNPLEISRAIKRVLENPNHAQEMVERGHEYVQKFSLEKTNKNILGLYKALL